MVKSSLKKVFIKNFKSLHDCEIDIGKMNVVVGANASGKSNLIEAFRLLKKIYADKESFPFLEWWGYDNVVWQRKEELPIIIGLLFDIEGYDVYFETSFTGVGQKFQILREVLDIKGYVKFEKEGEWLLIIHDTDFIETIIRNLNGYKSMHGGFYGAKKTLKKEKNQLIKEKKIRVDIEQRLFDSIRNMSWEGRRLTEKKTLNLYMISHIVAPRRFGKDEKSESITTLCPVIYDKEDGYHLEGPLFSYASTTILSTLSKQLILYPLNIRLMKVPQPFRREEIPKEDGSNIASVYHTIYLKEGKIPEEIYNPFSMIFPKIDVRPHITDDGRVMIKFFEDGFELLPPNTSDGFYKLLALLIAIYLKPPLLIVDEIENSLHPSTLELILDTIKIGDTQAIITTHSPVVVDMTELNNIILVEIEQGESKFKRIKDPDKIREFLIEKGITFSEGWIYGDLLKTEQ
ncbi:MAG: recombinase RecF [Candidatus Methanoperedens sp.]|nr:recombinase RecF [Candidatus Methanoperedens sp.]